MVPETSSVSLERVQGLWTNHWLWRHAAASAAPQYPQQQPRVVVSQQQPSLSTGQDAGAVDSVTILECTESGAGSLQLQSSSNNGVAVHHSSLEWGGGSGPWTRASPLESAASAALSTRLTMRMSRNLTLHTLPSLRDG